MVNNQIETTDNNSERSSSERLFYKHPVAWVCFTAAVVCLCSCARPAPNFSLISVGMTKTEVIQRLGKPDSFSAVDSTERLTYGKWDDSPTDGRIGGGRYFVKLQNNKVMAYGKYGDYDGSPRPSIVHLPPPPMMMMNTAPIGPLFTPPPTPQHFNQKRVFNVRPGAFPNSIEVRERAY